MQTTTNLGNNSLPITNQEHFIIHYTNQIANGVIILQEEIEKRHTKPNKVLISLKNGFILGKLLEQQMKKSMKDNRVISFHYVLSMDEINNLITQQQSENTEFIFIDGWIANNEIINELSALSKQLNIPFNLYALTSCQSFINEPVFTVYHHDWFVPYAGIQSNELTTYINDISCFIENIGLHDYLMFSELSKSWNGTAPDQFTIDDEINECVKKYDTIKENVLIGIPAAITSIIEGKKPKKVVVFKNNYPNSEDVESIIKLCEHNNISIVNDNTEKPYWIITIL